MKKKGLIVATIVMVLVLAVSLTTATYAWFTADAKTTIEAISFSVGTGSDVSIGLKIDNTYEEGAISGDFVFGTTTIGTEFAVDNVPNGSIPTSGSSYWGGNAGLGNKIDMQLDLQDMEKAVGTGMIGVSADALDLTTLRTTATADTNGVVMASGTSASVVTEATVVQAYAQRDYLDVVIGVQAAATDLNKIICNVTINPYQTDLDLGMNAAIHLAWEIDGDITDDSDGAPGGNIDVYSTKTHGKLQDHQANDYHYGTTVNTLLKSLVDNKTNTADYGGSNDQQLNNGAINIPITVADAGKDGESGEFLNISRETIYQIHLVIWIDGADSDCINQALGVGSTIYINFSAEAPGRA